MRILFVVPYTPTPIRVRPYHLLHTLRRRGHDVTLATLWQNEEERQALGGFEAVGIEIIAYPLSKIRSLWNCIQTLPTAAPLQAAYCWQPHFAQQMRMLVQHRTFDIIHVEHLRGARYALALKAATRMATRSTPVVWDSVDCISHLFAQAAARSRSHTGRLLTKLELQRTRHYENRLLDQFDQILVTSKVDQQALLALRGQVATDCADIDLQKSFVPSAQREMWDKTFLGNYTVKCASQALAVKSPVVLPCGVELDKTQSTGMKKLAKTLVFSGKMSYHANITAALYLVQEIMPHVWAVDPAVQVQIVGKDPPAQIRALTTAAGGAKQADKVVVTGTVPDIYPYLSQATIAVAPIVYGAGIQNKVLEAMACGTPVIASPQAVSGLQAQSGHDLLVADNAVDFAAAILALLQNPAQQAQLSQAGRCYVEKVHAWDVIGAQLETIYTTIRNV